MRLTTIQRHVLQAIVRGTFSRRANAPHPLESDDLRGLIEGGLIRMSPSNRKAYITEDGLAVLEADEHDRKQQAKTVWHNCGEGPWDRREDAEHFAQAEVGVKWRVVQAPAGQWIVEVCSNY